MSVQLLDKTRKINKLLHNNNSSKVVFNIRNILTFTSNKNFSFFAQTSVFESNISLRTSHISLKTTLLELLLCNNLLIFLVLSNNCTLICTPPSYEAILSYNFIIFNEFRTYFLLIFIFFLILYKSALFVATAELISLLYHITSAIRSHILRKWEWRAQSAEKM